MKKMVLVLCAIIAALFAAGCSQATPEEQYLSHWEKIVSIFNANKTDAAKAQAAVKSYLDAHLTEMNGLSAQFGKDTSKKIAEDPQFITRVLKLVDAINQMKKDNISIIDDPQVAQALAPLLAQ